MLDFRIDTFLTVCETLNFTKAANILKRTQPAISQHIHYLEQVYGTKLFQQEGKIISLTPAGKTLKQTVQAVKNDERHLRQKLQQTQKERQPFVLGATLTIAEFVLPSQLSVYLNKFQNASLHLTVANTTELLTKLEKGLIDFAFVEGYFPREQFESALYARQRYILVCSRDYHLSNRAYRLEELLSERLILRELGSGTRDVLEHYLEAQSLSTNDFNAKIEIGNIRAIKTLLQSGCGITFLYEAAVKEELIAGSLREIHLEDIAMSHDFSFIWQKGSVFKEEYLNAFHTLCHLPWASLDGKQP